MGLFDMFKTSGTGDEVSHEDLVQALKDKSVTLVDVREPGEYAAGHVEGALNLPLSAFDAAQLPAGKPVILMCRSGARSAQALARARSAGRTDVRHYRGGALGWSSAGGSLV